VLIVKILSLGTPERYAVRRMVTAAVQDLLQQYPNLDIRIIDVSDSTEIGKFAFTLVLPTLVINGKVVCSGRFPTREEVGDWLRQAINKT
jgi:Thioredoxin domain